MLRAVLCLFCLLPVLLTPTAGAGTAAETQRTLELVNQWVRGSYDNREQVAADAANNVPDALKHRQMFQLFAPVEIPAIPGHTVYQQASVDGSTDPDRIGRNGVLQFFADADSGAVRLRELKFKSPASFHNAQFNLATLTGLSLEDFDWNPGCDFFLTATADGSAVRGPIGTCQIAMGGQTLTADDEVVITPDEFWFLGRYTNAAGQIMWGNASDEHVKLRRTASLAATLKPAGGVLIVGGTRNTGLELARLLRTRGDTVTVFLRPTSDRSGLEPLDVRYAVGDAMNADDVDAAMQAARYTAVVSTLGCYGCEEEPDYIGNRNVFDAAKAHGVARVIMISTLGAGDSYEDAPWLARWVLKDVMTLKTRAEDHLKALELDYTIIRPGALKTAPATGQGELTQAPGANGMITRADLAQLIVDCLDDDATAGQTYTAQDTEMRWPWDMF